MLTYTIMWHWYARTASYRLYDGDKVVEQGGGFITEDAAERAAQARADALRGMR